LLANDAPLLLDVTRLIWRRWVGRHPTGIDRVCLAYLQHFGRRSQAVVHHPRYRRILGSKESADLFDLLSEPRTDFRRGLVKNTLRSAARRKHSGKSRLYLNIGHTGLNDPGFAAWTRNADVRPIYFVHDLIPITHPEYCREGEEARHVNRMRIMLTTGVSVIGNSQATLNDLADFGRANGLPSPPSLAAWLGTTEWLAPESSVAVPERPTFIALGTIEARKNHLMLLRIWERLIERFGDEAPRLLIIGQRGWECEQVFDLLDRNTMLKKAVVELSNCCDQELAGHIAGARALLFPSLIEGYGLPLIEALRAGTPVIASDLPVFREIGEGIPDFLESRDNVAWERVILDYADPGSRARQNQLRRLHGYRAPTWDDHFAKVDAWMEQI
jgi:glycosyltransferase involved in cell wall biosynthesis